MNLYISDVKMIGHTAFENDGHLAIISNGPLLEQILLREILALDGYRITAIEDYEWKDEESGVSGCNSL